MKNEVSCEFPGYSGFVQAGNPEKFSFEVLEDKPQESGYLYDLVHRTSMDKRIQALGPELLELYVARFGYPDESSKEIVESLS